MKKRKWTNEQVTDALATKGVPMKNKVNPGNPAMMHVEPVTGKPLVIDTKTREILQLAEKGFDFSDYFLP